MKKILLLVVMILVTGVVNAQTDRIATVTVGYVAEGTTPISPVRGVNDLHAISASLEPTIWIQPNEKDRNQGFKVAGVVYFKRQPKYENQDDFDTDTYAAGAVLSRRFGKGGFLEPWGRIVVGVRYITNREFTDIVSAGLDLNLGHFGIRVLEIGRQNTRSLYEPKESYIGAGLKFRF